MEGVCRGAKSVGGLTVGLLPGRDPTVANPWVDVVVPTGGNALVVSAATAVIGLDGEYGTLSEIALALRSGIPVIGIGTWTLLRPTVRSIPESCRWRTSQKLPPRLSPWLQADSLPLVTGWVTGHHGSGGCTPAVRPRDPLTVSGGHLQHTAP
jgi:hypothetical protein